MPLNNKNTDKEPGHVWEFVLNLDSRNVVALYLISSVSLENHLSAN